MTEAFVRNIDQFVYDEGVDLVAFQNRRVVMPRSSQCAAILRRGAALTPGEIAICIGQARATGPGTGRQGLALGGGMHESVPPPLVGRPVRDWQVSSHGLYVVSRRWRAYSTITSAPTIVRAISATCL
jgi:hypothetical protein